MLTSKYVKRTVSIVVLMAMLAGSLHYLGRKLIPVSYTYYYLHDLEVIKEKGEDVDMIVLGASRGLRTFVPSVFEEEMGLTNVINASSTSQPIEGSYYILKELLKDFHPRYVVVSLVVNGFRGDYLNEDNQRKLIIYDRLTGFDKIRFLFSSFKQEDLLYGVYAYRFRNNLTQMKRLNESWNTLVANEYKGNEKSREYYRDKGFVYGNNSLDVGNIHLSTIAAFKGRDDLKPERMAYLDKIIELCNEKGIKVFLVSAPTTDMRLYSTINYQEASDLFTEYAEQKGTVYHNLNFLMDRNEWLGDDMMHDYNHVNGQAAYLVTQKYCDILKRALNGEDVSDLLYANLDEYKKTVHRIVCVDAKITQDEKDRKDISMTLRSYQNDDITPVYKIEVSYDSDKWEVISDWSADKSFSYKLKSEKCKIRVTASTGDPEDAVAYQVYELN